MQTQPNQKVNVEWVKGDFETAQCEAFRRNRAASKHLSTDERSQFAWRYLCTQAVEGKLFIDNGRGSFVKPVKEMEGLFSLKRRTTMKLRSEIKNLFAHLEFNQEKLTEVLSTDLRSLSTARWQRQVKGVLAAFYEGTGLSESVSDQVFDEERLTLEMVEVLAKHMRPGWSTERQFADNFCDALGRLMSLSTQQRMVEWLADEETLEALIAAPKDPYEDVF